MKNTCLVIACFLLTGYSTITAQTVNVPASLESWDTSFGKPVRETYMGKECLLLQTGGIMVKGAELRDGTIEADINFTAQRGFPGFIFRIQDNNNMENFYVRPHQSGNPDATQYTPIFNGYAGWQLYHGEGYSKNFTFKFDQWHHVKIDLHGLQAEIYIDDMQTQLIKVTELLTGWKSGKFGFVSTNVPFRIANVQYSIKQGSAPAAIPVPANGSNGLVTQWQVANTIDRRLVDNQTGISQEIKERLKWTTHTSLASGTVDLARYIQPGDTGKAVIARIIIRSEKEQVKKIAFGFSDFVTVYCNGKALYAGSDNFMSRDYRFLGTIGFFDALFLPLKKGDNELWFVVSENFGGWGVKAKFDNMDGISLK